MQLNEYLSLQLGPCQSSLLCQGQYFSNMLLLHIRMPYIPRMFRERIIARELLTIGYPIILGMVSTTIMNLADIAMVGRLGAEAIAAVGLGGLIFYTIASFFNAISVGVQTLSARRLGEGRYPETTMILFNALILAVLSGGLTTLIGMLFGGGLLPRVNADPGVIRLGQDYLWFRFMGLGFFTINMAFHGFFNGIARTRIHFRVTVIANIINIIFNYLLIFGKLGLPAMGVSGAGLASTISLLLSLGMYVQAMSRGPIRNEFFGRRKISMQSGLIRQLVRLSLPVGLQEFLVHLGFLMFVVMVGMIGTVELAASHIVFNILSFSFMPGYGLGMASGTLVGKYLGEKRPELASRSGWVSMQLTIIFMGGVGVFFLLTPGTILRLFTADPGVIEEGILALRILGGIQFLDACGLSLSGALRGAGDTAFVSLTEICINLFCFLPLTYVMALVLGWGLLGAWLAFAFYIFLFALFMVFRFRVGQWQLIEV